MFQYSLRYTLDPQTNTPKKNDKLLDFCQNAMIDNVTFFMNAEEINAGHLTKEETQVWLDAIQKVAAQLQVEGITISLNPFSTIMHSDRGQVINPKIGFDPLVDIDGKEAQSMGCPGDLKWRAYLSKCYAQYATLKPKELWLEDDFRHFNHSPLKLACFCKRHMQLYQEKLGKKISRNAFVKAILKPGKPSLERKVYLDVARQEMIETVAQIEAAVHQVSPETNLALMTSLPDWHAVEGRDWQKLFETLSGNDHPLVARPHLPAYNEIAPLKYSRVFEDYTRTTAAYLGDKAILYPELENYMYSPFTKSNRFTQFQIETSILVGAKGILMNIFDMSGNGVIDDYHYAQMLADSKTFLNQLTSKSLVMSQTRGIKILVDQDSAYTLQTKAGLEIAELLPRETSWAALLSSFGFSTTITPFKSGDSFKDEIIAISGQFLRNLNNEEIAELLQDNKVLLDGESVQVLLDRKLADLLHIQKAQWHKARSGYQTYEAIDNRTIADVENPRISMLQHIGNFLQLDYDPKANVEIWSQAYNEHHQVLGNVMSLIDDHILILPLDYDNKYGWEAEYIGFKQVVLQQMLDSMAGIDYLVKMPNTKLVVTQSEAELLLWVANFTLDNYDAITWHPAEPIEATEATVIYRSGNNCIKKQVKLHINDDEVMIPVELPQLSLVQVQIEL